MDIFISNHARLRASERGASESEIIETILTGEVFEAKFNRKMHRKNFTFENSWNNKYYNTKQLEVTSVVDGGKIIVVTLIVKFF